jgi:uncharacterized membrane-anchored protein YjiN (DUF445 family)
VRPRAADGGDATHVRAIEREQDASVAAPPASTVPPLAPVAPPPVVTAPPLADEALKQQRLDVMKRRATLLLVAAAVVFAIARALESRYPWLGFVRATAEAAMVGGVADWFAVTALFRQPLGLPIPHTAIIPARKDRIGRSLGGFVQKNFLARDVVAAKLASMQVGAKAAGWLSEPAHAQAIARQVSAGLAGAANVLRDEDVQEFIDRSIVTRVRSTQVAPLLGRGIALLTADRRHQELLDAALRLVARLVAENEESIRGKIGAESPWWVPGAVDDKIHEKLVTAVERTLAEVSADPEHPLRARFDEVLADFVERLRSSPNTITRAEELKEELLEHPAVRGFSASLWADVKRKLLASAEHPETGALPGAVERGLVSLGHAISADPVLIAKVDGWITDAVLFAVEQYRSEVAELIEQTVNRWDPMDTSRKIELQIGRDLQFIRINGTLVGGLVGLALYSIGLLF